MGVARGMRHCSPVMIGYRASRCGKEGLSRSCSECSRKPWVHSTCASDRRELLRVPLRSQGHCGFGRGPSLLNWVWCNRRGPHLEWRQEPQGSSPYLTRVAGYLWRRLLEVPWTARRSNQSILKEISREYSLEGKIGLPRANPRGRLIKLTHF